MQTFPYLTFNGKARQAMNFYKKCLGGRLTFQTLGESPFASKMPAKMKKNILQATLEKGSLTLMASDMVSDSGLTKGNSVSIMLNCHSEKEIRRLYKALSMGGKEKRSLEKTYWGELLGSFTDKYGNNWLLYYEEKK